MLLFPMFPRSTSRKKDGKDHRYFSPPDAVDSVAVKLSGLELRRPRTYGSCRLACELWHPLRLDEFWQPRLPEAREA